MRTLILLITLLTFSCNSDCECYEITESNRENAELFCEGKNHNYPNYSELSRFKVDCMDEKIISSVYDGSPCSSVPATKRRRVSCN